MTTLNLNENKKQTDCLSIAIGEETYNMPLAGAMPMKILKKATAKDADVNDVIEVLTMYIPEEVVDYLTVDDVKAIFEAWGEASKEVSGVEPGK